MSDSNDFSEEKGVRFYVEMNDTQKVVANEKRIKELESQNRQSEEGRRILTQMNERMRTNYRKTRNAMAHAMSCLKNSDVDSAKWIIGEELMRITKESEL